MALKRASFVGSDNIWANNDFCLASDCLLGHCFEDFLDVSQNYTPNGQPNEIDKVDCMQEIHMLDTCTFDLGENNCVFSESLLTQTYPSEDIDFDLPSPHITIENKQKDHVKHELSVDRDVNDFIKWLRESSGTSPSSVTSNSDEFFNFNSYKEQDSSTMKDHLQPQVKVKLNDDNQNQCQRHHKKHLHANSSMNFHKNIHCQKKRRSSSTLTPTVELEFHQLKALKQENPQQTSQTCVGDKPKHTQISGYDGSLLQDYCSIKKNTQESYHNAEFSCLNFVRSSILPTALVPKNNSNSYFEKSFEIVNINESIDVTHSSNEQNTNEDSVLSHHAPSSASPQKHRRKGNWKKRNPPKQHKRYSSPKGNIVICPVCKGVGRRSEKRYVCFFYIFFYYNFLCRFLLVQKYFWNLLPSLPPHLYTSFSSNLIVIEPIVFPDQIVVDIILFLNNINCVLAVSLFAKK